MLVTDFFDNDVQFQKFQITIVAFYNCQLMHGYGKLIPSADKLC